MIFQQQQQQIKKKKKKNNLFLLQAWFVVAVVASIKLNIVFNNDNDDENDNRNNNNNNIDASFLLNIPSSIFSSSSSSSSSFLHNIATTEYDNDNDDDEELSTTTTTSSSSSSSNIIINSGSSTNTSTSTKIIIWLGIACSNEQKEVILDTYLSNKTITTNTDGGKMNNKKNIHHSFQHVCSIQDDEDEEKTNKHYNSNYDDDDENKSSSSSSCLVRYKIWPPNTSIRTWLLYLIDHNTTTTTTTTNSNSNSIVLWIPSGRTMIYPPYFYDYLINTFMMNKESNNNKNNNNNNHQNIISSFVGDTPKIDCNKVSTGKRQRMDKLACNKLSGKLSMLSYDVLESIIKPCLLEQEQQQQQNKNNGGEQQHAASASEETTSSLNDLIKMLMSTTSSCANNDNNHSIFSLKVEELPRQYDKPDIKGFKFFWDRLVEWNSFPFSVDYITAKFGRNNKFKKEIDLQKTLLLANGYHPRNQIYAYFQYPNFITSTTTTTNNNNNNRLLWESHLEFLYNTSLKPKGGGYWFWKAPLLLHQLYRVKFGDIVVYADADLHDHTKWLPGLFRRMVDTNTSLALYSVDYKDQNYTKRDVYEYYCGSSSSSHSHNNNNNNQSSVLLVQQSKDDRWQYAAGLIVVRKTTGVINFIEKWQDGMSNYTMLNDSPSIFPNHDGFQYHLHDQSILSVIVKCTYNDAYMKRKIFDGATTLNDWNVELFEI